MTKYNKNYVFDELSDEDTVQCLFFVSSLEIYENWDHLCTELNNEIKSLSHDYLWHKDAFKVFLPISEKHNTEFPPHLASITSFGDNIEDEWFIVHIILALTKKHKDLIVRLQDNDGDFLLIEAADHLPQWANPETTENRVFIYDNHIHLIPPNIASVDETLSLEEAIQLICKFPTQTRVSVQLEQTILNRIGKYPDKIQDNIHKTTVKVPHEIAVLLNLRPHLIAPIVDAYCHHDVIDAKGFRNISCNDWVTVPVKFTKCLYALLLYSKLASTIRQPVDKDQKTTLGLKLACGFHMIMKRSSDIFSSKEYLKFLNSLKENGYFDNNIEGSLEYNKKLKSAQEFFSTVECPIASNVSQDINQIMATDEYLKAKELILMETDMLVDDADDNDDWLTLHPEQLNEMLNSRYGKKTKFQKGDILTPQNVTAELKNFLKHTSDFEGIETNNSDTLESKIEFDADQFEGCIEKMLKLLTSNNDGTIDSDSDFIEENMSLSEDEDEIDKEIKEKLHGVTENFSDNDMIMKNIIKSMKEEKASVGPSSNLIANVGLRKTDFLDSDDEE